MRLQHFPFFHARLPVLASAIAAVSLAAVIAVIAGFAASVRAVENDEDYRIESIPFPEGVPPEVGDMDFNPSGELVVALRRSDVLVAAPTEDPKGFEWRLFASGLHNACGLQVLSDGEIVISQMPELTRLVDEDGDGKADRHERIAAPWGLSGNYHETNHLVPDGEGGWFVAVGTASHNGPVFYHTKGEFSRIGRRGRNFSSVPWKGWILRIDAEGKTTPWASGFRMHNGLLLDSKGRLWAGDNQGDWRAATPFYHIKKGNFYGHPSSLIWDPEWPEGEDPLDLTIAEVDEMRTPPAVILPHMEMNRSAAEPVEIPGGDAFGPYGGQILLPDNNGERITRLMLEEVDGVWQGAGASFYEEDGLRMGNNRLVFSPDKKTLYVGQTSRGWGPVAEGIQRIAFTGETPFDIRTMSLTKKGFRLEFTGDLPDKVEEQSFAFRRYRYQPTPEYGGDRLDESKIEIEGLRRVDDRTLELDLAKFDGGGWVYEMTVEGLASGEGKKLRAGLFCYTVNRLR